MPLKYPQKSTFQKHIPNDLFKIISIRNWQKEDILASPFYIFAPLFPHACTPLRQPCLPTSGSSIHPEVLKLHLIKICVHLMTDTVPICL